MIAFVCAYKIGDYIDLNKKKIQSKSTEESKSVSLSMALTICLIAYLLDIIT